MCMKRNYIFLFCAATLFSLGACEMSDELSGDKEEKVGTGTLELNVATKTPSALTRTVDAAAADFPVTITNSEDKVVASYTKATDLPSSIKLTVGDYTVAAHTPGDLIRTMSAPYYGGSVDLPITKDVTTERTVTCTMQNSRIEVNYDPTFLENFTSWTVTVNDGGENAPSFDEKNTDPAPVYLLFGDKVATVNVDIKAVTIKDETVSASFALTKADATEGYDNVENGTYFVGGDAIIITLKPTEMLEGSVSGLNYSAQIVFGETEENVVIVVDDVPLVADDEEEGEDGNEDDNPTGAPKLTCDAFTSGVTFSYSGKNFPSATDVVISAPKGIASLKVVIEGGNPGFTAAVEDLNFIGEGRELVGDTELGESLVMNMPSDGDTNYTFPIAGFYSMMNIYGPTVDADSTDESGKSVGLNNAADSKNSHVFKMLVTDKEGQTASAELSVTITK